MLWGGSMRQTGWLIAAILAGVAAAQTAQESRVLHISSAQSNEDLQELATVIRSIADIRDLSVDAAERTFTFKAGTEQAHLAEWVARELDGPEQSSEPYSIGADDVVRIFHLNNAPNVQGFQEMATAVRSMADMPRIYAYYRSRAIVARGSRDQIALGEWLFGELDRPLSLPPPGGVRQFQTTGAGADNVVRVFRLMRTATVQDFQEVAVMVRGIGEIRRVFTYNAPRALILRGTPDQVALAEWLIGQVNTAVKPADTMEAHEFETPSTHNEGAVRLFRMAHAATPQRLQEIAQEARTTGQIRRVFICNAPRLVAMRGTGDQMQAAARLLAERDRN